MYFSSGPRGLTFKWRSDVSEVANWREEIGLSGMGVSTVISPWSKVFSEGIWSRGVMLGVMESSTEVWSKWKVPGVDKSSSNWLGGMMDGSSREFSPDEMVLGMKGLSVAVWSGWSVSEVDGSSGDVCSEGKGKYGMAWPSKILEIAAAVSWPFYDDWSASNSLDHLNLQDHLHIGKSKYWQELWLESWRWEMGTAS